MTDVYSKALDDTLEINRVIGEIHGKKNGPTVVIFAGIHGNEPAGVFALQKVFSNLNPNDVQGSVYGIVGNTKALEKGVRFIESDLNRIWTKDNVKRLKSTSDLNQEEEEAIELIDLLNKITENNRPPYYFIDLHTTSSKSLPFITINDSLINRGFSSQFPTPIILGIEEYLTGPLLSYINTLGYVSLGFESGQHDDKEAIDNAEAFIWLTLSISEAINKLDHKDFERHFSLLKTNSKGMDSVFEIIFLHRIETNSDFKMEANYESFQKINKGEIIASEKNNDLISEHDGLIFMPLYQKIGQEGFFIIRKIHPIFMKLSKVLRNLKVDGFLSKLPGVSWADSSKDALMVNLKVARFLATPFLHLLGYRNKQLDATHLKAYNRERASKTDSYKHTTWYKKASS